MSNDPEVVEATEPDFDALDVAERDCATPWHQKMDRREINDDDRADRHFESRYERQR